MLLGLAHLERPQCIMWYHGESTSMEWMSEPTLEDEIRITSELKQLEVQFGHSGTESIPLMSYEEFKNGGGGRTLNT